MTTLKEAAQAYEPKKTLNIADLDNFDVSEPIEERNGKDTDGKEFFYSVLIRDAKEYRIPTGVIADIKNILSAYEKNGKDVSTFAVTKTGEGINTRYSIVALE